MSRQKRCWAGAGLTVVMAVAVVGTAMPLPAASPPQASTRPTATRPASASAPPAANTSSKAPAAAQPAGASAPAVAGADLFKELGLTSVGGFYLLAGDAQVVQSLGQLRAAKSRLDDYARKRDALSTQFIKATERLIAVSVELEGVRAKQLTGGGAGDAKNSLLTQATRLDAQYSIALQQWLERGKALGNLPGVKDDYVAMVMDACTSLEKTDAQYKTLSANSKLVAAIDALPMVGKIKSKLGPSPQFSQELQKLRDERDHQKALAIPFELQGGVPHVDVLINGTVSRTMVFDSGASIVAISKNTADALGIKPGKNDRTATFYSADGKPTKDRLAILDSIRLGSFEVKNVECSISANPNAPDLLGGTFLNNFMTRLDLAGGQIHLIPASLTINESKTTTAKAKSPDKILPDTPGSAGGAPPNAGATSAGSSPQSGTPQPAPTKSGKLMRTDFAGKPNSKGEDFQSAAPQGQFLVGMTCTVGKGPNGATIVCSFQPVFGDGSGKTSTGDRLGKATSDTFSLLAKPGYAVGGMDWRSGLRVDGVKLIYMRIQGETLNTGDTYESQWVGSKPKAEVKHADCSGKRVVGLYGNGGQWANQVGLIYED